MIGLSIILILALFAAITRSGKLIDKDINPPHCAQVTKSTDYQARFKYDYPTVYIPPGEREAYQYLYCINPSVVNHAVSMVCDWAALPLVQYTMGDEYLHIIRQDPTGRYLGNAVVITRQLCSHNHMINSSTPIRVIALTDNYTPLK